MVKSCLVFFDSINESKQGTIRGIIAFLCLIVPLYFILDISVIPLTLLTILLASSLAVQQKTSQKAAILYGGLVGLVCSMLLFLTTQTPLLDRLKFLLFIPLFSLTSFILFSLNLES